MKSLEALEAWIAENGYTMLVGVNGYYITQSEDGRDLVFSSGEWDINETYKFSVKGIDQMEQEQHLVNSSKIPNYRSIHEFYKTEQIWIIENGTIKYMM